ncbi:MAG: hypothetical protein M1826_006264 [Phylliscum demangeonii]|nr:MAG: hypothetical protein M1826_006264 [Phylliscum demangeonii]
MYESVRRDPIQLAAYHAYQYDARTQLELIMYIMKRDQGFLRCMERMRKSLATMKTSYSIGFLFFAAEVCQRVDERDFGIVFPRVENYLADWKEEEQYSEANIVARVQAKKSKAKAKARAKARAKEKAMAKAEEEEKAKEQSEPSNAFQTLPAPTPPRGLSRTMLRLASTARHWGMGMKKVPWAQMETKLKAPFKTESKALLLEGHY